MKNWKNYELAAIIVMVAGFAYFKSSLRNIPSDLRDAVASQGSDAANTAMEQLKGASSNEAAPVPAAVGVNAEYSAVGSKTINKSLPSAFGPAARTPARKSGTAALPGALETAYQRLPDKDKTPAELSRYEKLKTLFESGEPVMLKDISGKIYTGRTFDLDEGGRIWGSALALVDVVLKKGSTVTTPAAGPLFPAETVTVPDITTAIPVWGYAREPEKYDVMASTELSKIFLSLSATWANTANGKPLWAKDIATGISGVDADGSATYAYEIRRSGDYLMRCMKENRKEVLRITYGYYWEKK